MRFFLSKYAVHSVLFLTSVPKQKLFVMFKTHPASLQYLLQYFSYPVQKAALTLRPQSDHPGN